MQTTPSHPWKFFILVWVMSLPFWIASYYIQGSNLPDNLPLTDIGAALTPMIAAAILRYKEGGTQAVKHLFARTFDISRIRNKKWLWVAVFLFPLLYVLTFIVQDLSGFSVGKFVFPSLMVLLGTLVMFFIAATVEELGYAAYATEALQKKYNSLMTALIIGVPWALWHLNSMIQVGQTPLLIIWGLLGTVAVRVLYVWLFNNTYASVFALILCHTIANTARTNYPGGRSAYELGEGMIAYGIIIIVTIIIICIYGKDLGRKIK